MPQTPADLESRLDALAEGFGALVQDLTKASPTSPHVLDDLLRGYALVESALERHRASDVLKACHCVVCQRVRFSLGFGAR